jgi:predicted  nucleic acid-binding Zn-ribbon protein
MINPSLRVKEGAASQGEFKADGIDVVRTLRDLSILELDCTEKSPELEFRRSTLRDKLPTDILRIHDMLVGQGKPSVAPRFANACTECSGDVTIAPNTKRVAEMFVECPHCGTLLYG